MSAPKVVLLGMMTKIPVGGPIWLVAHYALGFRRLGFDVYYVEAHGRTPSMLMEHDDDDPAVVAAEFIDRHMRRFGLGGKWAYHSLHDDVCHGLSRTELDGLYRDAALIVNMHGGTVPLPEHSASGRLVYLGTDPVELELELAGGDQGAIAFLEPHVARFTWGLNHGNPRCGLPVDARFGFVPSPPPVLVDLWHDGTPPGSRFTTIGNWRQVERDLVVGTERFTWSKHHEFLKVIDLPQRVGARFELALSSCEPDDVALLEGHGWGVVPALDVSRDVDRYRDHIRGSGAEFTVAKDQNVRFRTGWFSERSATYLAAGRPVIMQDTGFSDVLPTGEGLLCFDDVDGAAAAVEEVMRDPARHAAAAVELARELFDADVVLGTMLDHMGLVAPARSTRRFGVAPCPFPPALRLEPLRRHPLMLDQATFRAVTAAPVPVAPVLRRPVAASVVMVTWNGLAFTRLALESVLAHSGDHCEVVVVDNHSEDGTLAYLGELAQANPRVSVTANHRNRGFAAATNQGVAASSGPVVVLLNNDVIVTPGWLEGLLAHLDDEVALVGPTTGRGGNEADLAVLHRTYAELLAFAAARRELGPSGFDVSMLTMFCVALRRSTWDRLGPLDEGYGLGTFEDDDYAQRVRRAGLRLRCAEDVFVHHFGQASFGRLVASGDYGPLHAGNRRRFEQRWRMPWEAVGRRPDATDERARAQVRRLVEMHAPRGVAVAVVSRGDDELLRLGDRDGRHFPAAPDGGFLGHYPADGAAAVRMLEEARQKGAGAIVFPSTSAWWLEHYAELASHLERHAIWSAADEGCVIYGLPCPGNEGETA